MGDIQTYECWFCGQQSENPVYCDYCGERINLCPEDGIRINWGLLVVLACVGMFWFGVFKLVF